MSEPIFERVMHDIGSHLTFRHHNQISNQEGPPEMSFADDIKTDLTDGLDYVEGWVGRAKQAAPEILTRLQKYANSPVVTALETAGAAIDPPAEAIIAGWIRDLANLRAPAPAAAADPAADPGAQSDPAVAGVAS